MFRLLRARVGTSAACCVLSRTSRCYAVSVVRDEVAAGLPERLAREDVGVDYGEGVWRLGEDGGDGGFAGCDGAGEADD